MTFFRLVAILLLVALAGPARGQPKERTSWYVITADSGDKIGQASEKIIDGPDGRQIVEERELGVAEHGTAPTRITTRSVTLEDKAGRPTSIVISGESSGSRTRIAARIDGDKAELTRDTPADTRTATLTLPAGVRFDLGDGLLKDWDAAKTPRLEFDSLNVEAMAVDHVVIAPVPSTAPGPDGGITALRESYHGGQLVGVAKLTLDRAHGVLSTTQPMFGTNLTTRETDRETATAPYSAFHVLSNVMHKSPFRIPAAAEHGHIRYRYAFKDGIVFSLPQTGEQAVAAGPDFAVVDICDGCGPGLPADEDSLADALKPTAWLQSDAPKIKAIAAEVAAKPIPNAQKMTLLTQMTSDLISRVDFVGYYSALEALQRRAGDCTETAVLLAALGRAAGIPTKVADGLVYSRERYHGVSNVFMPHSWTLAWVDGKWRSFDAALADFDSTHIAITVGDGDERSMVAAEQLAGLLQWDGMGEVRNRAGN